MYSPAYQANSSDTLGPQFIIVLVIVAIAWAVLAYLNSRTEEAAPYSRSVTTSLTREQVIKLVEGCFPRSIIAKEFNWQLSWEDDRFQVSGYYLTNNQGCLVMLLTGIIPGYLAIRFAMKRSELAVIDFSEFEGTGELMLEAKGLRARSKVDKLANRLGKAA